MTLRTNIFTSPDKSRGYTGFRSLHRRHTFDLCAQYFQKAFTDFIQKSKLVHTCIWVIEIHLSDVHLSVCLSIHHHFAFWTLSESHLC